MSGSNVPQRVLPYSPFARNEGAGLNSPEIDIRDFGAPDTDGDATSALKAAMALPIPKTIVIPGHTYTITDECVTTVDGTFVRGMGSRATWLNFQPASGGLSCLRWGGTVGSALHEVGVSDLRIQSTAGNTQQKFAVRMDVCSVMRVENIVVGTSSNTFSGGPAVGPFSKSSSGFYLNGWENLVFRNNRMTTDIPIRVGPNPNDPNLAFDLATISDSTLICLDDGACVWLESGANVTRVTIRDSNLHPGRYGIYRLDTTANAASFRLSLSGIGFEQSKYDGYEVYLESTLKLFSFVFKESSGGGGAVSHSGLFLRNVDEVTLSDLFWGLAGRKFLDADAATITRIRGTNVNLIANTTVSLGGMVVQDSDGHAGASAVPLPRDFLLVGQDSQFAAGLAHRDGAIYKPVPLKGTLANNGDLPLSTFSGGFQQAWTTITFKGATKRGGFEVYYDTTGAKMISPVTADVDAGAIVGGKITVAWSSASSVFLANRLGESVTYTVETRIV
jgi:hypothetical protein